MSNSRVGEGFRPKSLEEVANRLQGKVPEVKEPELVRLTDLIEQNVNLLMKINLEIESKINKIKESDLYQHKEDLDYPLDIFQKLNYIRYSLSNLESLCQSNLERLNTLI